MKKVKTVYFGTPDFSVPSLELLASHPQIDLKLVVSMPDRPAGRGKNLKSPEVIEFAKAKKIPYFQTENINKEEEKLKELESEGIDVVIVLAFAQFLGSKILNLPKTGCFNIHTSLLPKYRGAAPIQYALLNGDNSTGVSIQKMVKKMDAGDIVKEYELPLSNDETGGQLYTRLKFQAANTLNEFIQDITNNSITSRKQNENDATFAPTLKKEDGHINFENDFQEIWNRVRALKPWPGTFCFLNSKRLKVIEIEEYSSKKLNPRQVDIGNGLFLVGAKDKTIRLKTIQFEGKKVQSDKDFLNGFKDEALVIS